ncbi:hypothetical protein IAR55_004393 [Kwoniella newhampshirensis]|uniref:PH domain-containing protein n=1 Tax=Kwoniella newhampshirensis TaxID=1651941 RepID=A0AAW0Z0I1_9TREE
MPTSPPPLSPTPRRWRSPTQQPLPEFAALLSSFESETAASTSEDTSSRGGSMPGWATPHGRTEEDDETRREEEDEAEVEYLTAASSVDEPRGRGRTPEIMTTSPSPQKGGFDSSLSPLLSPDRGQLFGEDVDTAVGRTVLQISNGSRGSLLGPREHYRPQQPLLDTPPSDESQPNSSAVNQPIPPQTTGQSTSTIDAAYDGVLSQLDALANPVASDLSHSFTSSTSTSSLPAATSNSTPAGFNSFHSMPMRHPLVGLGINPWGTGGDAISRLSTVTERTERSLTSSSTSPPVPGGYRESSHSDFSVTSIAGRFPLPVSPVKGPRPAGATPQGTPKKTSDLIKMFESRSGGSTDPPPPAQLQSTSSQDSQNVSQQIPTLVRPQRLESIFNVPSSISGGDSQPLNHSSPFPPTPPLKSPSPLSQVRTMIASWRARAGSPSHRVIGSPGEGGDTASLFGRGGDRGWNVSIRRRKRHERELAEQAEESKASEVHHPHEEVVRQDEANGTNEISLGTHGEEGSVPSRSASLKSDKKTTSEPKQFTGEPLRTGALYYLNVHDDEIRPNYKWVQADGRLYQEGLELTWISPRGRAAVTLDLEFCEEVASTYSPNNPMAGDDIGATAARRQGDLADNLYPFKLVYDDGVERLACDSARERVRWVNAIWTVLERTRMPTADRSASLRANRSSSDHGSDAGGSASTHFTPAEMNQPLPSPRAPLTRSLYTTDDAVIETSGGLHAPIIHRGSRRLAVGGLERGRSLRRTASEADLRDSAGSPPPLPEKDVDSLLPRSAVQDIPLTAETASRPTSRDFAFAHGIKPPVLASDNERNQRSSASDAMSSFHTITGSSTMTPVTAYHSLESSSNYQSASPSVEVQGMSMTGSTAYIAQQGSTVGQSPSTYTAQMMSQSPVVTARDFASSSSMYTPQQTLATTASYASPTEVAYTAPSVQVMAQSSPTGSAFTARTSNTATAGLLSPIDSAHILKQNADRPRGTTQTFHSSTTMYTAENPQTPVRTVRDIMTSSTHSTESKALIPHVAVTRASPGEIQSTVPTVATAEGTESGLYAASQASVLYHTAGESHYTSASGFLGSPFHIPTPPSDRSGSRLSRISDSDESYETAPPPVPSRDSHYSTASIGLPSTKAATSTPSSPMKYQLHDPPIPSYEDATNRASTASLHQFYTEDSKGVSRPPTPQWATAISRPQWAGTEVTAPVTPSRSPHSSEWETAPPPPISHDHFSDDGASSRLTDGLGTRRGSRAWTQVSHPDSDDELLADLERRSSTGSTVSKRPRSKKSGYASGMSASQTMWTVQNIGDARSGRTPLGTASENTMYTDARTSAYTTAATWQSQSTYMTTAPAMTSYYTARTSQIAPIRGEAPPTEHTPSLEPESLSTASTVAAPSTRRIPRIPPPRLPPPSPPYPSPDPNSTEPSSSSSSESSGTVQPRGAVNGYDIYRILNFLQGQEQAKQGQTTRIGTQLDRIERKVNRIAEKQIFPTERDRPPPVPSKNPDDEPLPSSPTSSTSSIETARPITPPPVIMPEVITSQFDDLRSLLGNIIGRQEDMAQELARRRSFDVEIPDRGPGLSRLEHLLQRLLQRVGRVGDSSFADEVGRVTRNEKEAYRMSHLSHAKTEGTKDGSMYEGGESVYSGEFNPPGRRAPANSHTSDFDRRHRGSPTELSDTLINGEILEPDFDEDFALSGLPPDTPPGEYVPRHHQVPPQLVARRAAQAQTTQDLQPEQPEYEEAYQDATPQAFPEAEQEEPITEYEPTPQPTPVPPPKEIAEESPIEPPIPYRTDDHYDDGDRTYEEEAYTRGPTHQGPPPQPVDLPTPVNSLRNMPSYQSQQQGQYPMRPPFPGGMPPPAPGMTDVPRPSLPRIGGVRDPISTTYLRRGFPPGPMGMGPMGMFPGPMGIPGPGMGPFMPGLRPGMPGFGGPIGPNVNPSLRRPGFFPPGVTSTTGDYGLPAGARYGNAGLAPSSGVAGRPPWGGSGQTTTADTGLGNTTSESTASTPSALTEEIVTPAAATTHIPEPVEISATPALSVSSRTDDGFRRVLGNNQALAAAQGEQQNEMSRYLHGMSDQIADGTLAAQNQLAEIMGDIAALREQLKPKHVHAHVLPDGTVMLDNGAVLDGILGVPAPVPPGTAPPPPPKTASHVEGKILPDGTVMAGGKIVDGIKGAPTVSTPATPAEMLLDEPTQEQLKDMEQDKKLAELQDKIAELMQRTQQPTFEEEEMLSIKADTGSPPVAASHMGIPDAPPTTLGTPGIAPTRIGHNTDVTREKTVIKEREVVREGPFGRHKEVDFATEVDKDMVTEVPPARSAAAPSTVTGTAGPGTVGMTDLPGLTTGMSHNPPSTVPPASLVPTAGASAPATPTGPITATPMRMNPRTGKPLTVPAALSAHSMSPIQTEYNYGDQPSNQLVREEHEEIIQRPGDGLPVHTHTTTRTYTQHPSNGRAVSARSGSVMGDPAAAGSAGAPATVFADLPDNVPGSHHSDHIATSEHDPPNMPSQRSVHEDTQFVPAPIPVNTHQNSVSHTHRPALTVSDPTGGSVAPPSSAGGAAPVNVPSARAPATVWQTNHPRSPRPAQVETMADEPDALDHPSSTTAHNIPTGTPADAGSNTPHKATSEHASDFAVPAAQSRTAEEVPSGATVPKSGSSKGKSGVHWDKRIPDKEVSSTPARGAQDETFADLADPPAATAHNVPSEAGLASGAQDESANPAASPTHKTHNEKQITDTPQSGILRKSKSKNNNKTSTSQPDAGVPIVSSDTAGHANHATVGQAIPSNGNDKNTRVADTAHVSHHPTVAELPEEGRGLTAQPGDQTLHVPAHPTGGPGSKLKKKPVPEYVEGDMPDAKDVTSGAQTQGRANSGVPLLEEVVLPDGQTAYIRSRPASDVALPTDPPAPPGARQPKKVKKSRGDPGTRPEGDAPGASQEADVTQSRDQIEPSLTNAQVARQQKSHRPSRPPSVHPLGLPEAEGVGGLGEEVVLEKDEGTAEGGPDGKKAGSSNKLTKGKKAGPASSLTPEEEAMEDARKLAVKQKAAAEQAAAEKAERDAKLQEKEAKAKLAEDRHRQNVEALTNLQKVLDLLANDNKTAKTLQDEGAKSQEKRRADKSVRDKKITEALEKLVADREEAKKKQSAEDKKPGTQAILDALKTSGDSQAAFLRKLATEMMDNNSSQHQKTQQAMKNAAREQVGFNLAGYLDDFSKALSGEVRTLLKEVGDLRESRRALYMELAELLLMKGRQSAGDLMAILPYPAAPAKANQPKQNQPKDNKDQNKAPAWATWAPVGVPPPLMGRPLPQPGMPPPTPLNLSGGAVPPPPPAGGRPLPKV